MARKTTTAPLDRLTLTEWRNDIATWKGVAWASIASAQQTVIDRLLNEAFEMVSNRADHEDWGHRETTITLTAGTDVTYESGDIPADLRRVLDVVEESTIQRIRASLSSRTEFNKSEDGSDAHPWTTRDTPVWFFDEWSNDTPPVQRWRRVGTDNTGATARLTYRPYFALLNTSGSDQFNVLPPSVSAAVRYHVFAGLEAFKRDFEAASFYRQMREDEIHAHEVGGRGQHEDTGRIQPDSDFLRQMG